MRFDCHSKWVSSLNRYKHILIWTWPIRGRPWKTYIYASTPGSEVMSKWISSAWHEMYTVWGACPHQLLNNILLMLKIASTTQLVCYCDVFSLDGTAYQTVLCVFFAWIPRCCLFGVRCCFDWMLICLVVVCCQLLRDNAWSNSDSRECDFLDLIKSLW